MVEDVGNPGHGAAVRLPDSRRFRCPPFRCEFEIKKAMAVVEGRPKQLTTRQVFIGRGDAPFHGHSGRVDRFGVAETRQRGAVGTQQECRLYQIAPRLFDRECCEVGIVDRALIHHPVGGDGELGADLLDRQFLDRHVAPPGFTKPTMGVPDRPLPAFNRDIHGSHLQRRGARQAGKPPTMG